MSDFKKPLTAHTICGACRQDLLYIGGTTYAVMCTDPKCSQYEVVIDSLTGIRQVKHFDVHSNTHRWIDEDPLKVTDG